jgi:hypothetical protein
VLALVCASPISSVSGLFICGLDYDRPLVAGYEFLSDLICASSHVFVSSSTTQAPLVSRADYRNWTNANGAGAENWAEAVAPGSS